MKSSNLQQGVTHSEHSPLKKESTVPYPKYLRSLNTIIVSALGGAALCSYFFPSALVILLIGGLIGGLIGVYASRK